MSDLFIGLCSYLALQGKGDQACRTTMGQAYNQSAIRTYYDTEQKQLEHYGLGVYETLPLNKPLSAISVLGYETYKKDFKLPLTSSINLEYSNFNTYNCNLKWSW